MKVRKDWMAPGLALALAAMFTVGSLATPAGAHLGDFSHLKKHFYTKKKARATFLENTKTVVAHDLLNSGIGQSETKQVNCPSGWQATGGGVHFQSETGVVVDVTWNGPVIEGDNIVAADAGINGPATGWKVSLTNQGGSGHNYSVAVICAK